MLMRTDPFRELERLADGGLRRAPRSFPMDAHRRGDHFVMSFDIPGVAADSIDLTVERNVLTVRAERRPQVESGDEVVVAERPYGELSRQVFLGDTLDPERIEADYADGVLTLTIPIAESAKPRRIEVGASGRRETIEASAG